MLSGGFSIGRIFGIKIRFDWSWILIFLLVSWNLAIVFGNLHPDWSELLRIGLAILASLLFFGSVLAHELAHSFMALAQGIQVRKITLFLFGGVSDIQQEPPTPRAEFLITIVGPLTSIGLGIIFLLLFFIQTEGLQVQISQPQDIISQLGPFSTLMWWLGTINIFVGVFNLIPGFPLDGGRILRSVIWVITDNLRKATCWASWVGQGIAWLMIATGAAMVFGVRFPILGSGLVNGLWLIFIGWFLSNAAVQSYRQIVIRDILEGVDVERMMRRDPPIVAAQTTVDSLVQDGIMGTDDHAFPVKEDDEMVGLVTLDDIRDLQRDKWSQATVGEIMTPRNQLSTIPPDEDAADALSELSNRDVRQLPVMRNGQLVGVLRRRDIVQWLQLHDQEVNL